jgi:hypothetical protein
MKTTLIYLGIIFLIRYLIKESSNSDDSKHRNEDNLIEKGYPTPNMQSLHINSKKEPPISNHYLTDEQISNFEEDNDPENDYKQIYSKNMFVESHYELNISLFERELTVKMVNDAYEKVLNDHLEKISKGIPEVFNINDKKEARDYLLDKLTKESKS